MDHHHHQRSLGELPEAVKLALGVKKYVVSLAQSSTTNSNLLFKIQSKSRTYI